MATNTDECLNRYEGHGLQFDYPGYWELTEEEEGDDALITVSADGASFWALRVLYERPKPEDAVNACVEAFQEEYEDAEVQETTGMLARQRAVCREVNFSCFELLNTVSLFSVRCREFTILAWWQGTDHELTDTRPVFEKITQSVTVLRP